MSTAPSTGDDPLLRWFNADHLRPELQTVVNVYRELARGMVIHLPASAERTVALRKLLESKDAAVRATVAHLGVD